MSSRIKGAHLISTLTTIREVVGLSRLPLLINACPPNTQGLLRRTLMAVEWIPSDSWFAFLQVLLDTACQKDETQFRKLMRAVCKREFATTHRVMLSNIQSRAELAAKAERIWAGYFDSGSVHVVPPEEGADQDSCVVTLRDLSTSYSVAAVTIQAYIEQLLVMCGAPSVVQRSDEQLRGGKLAVDYLIRPAPPTAAPSVPPTTTPPPETQKT